MKLERLEMKTEQEARDEYHQIRNDDPAFAECWADSNYDFYEWCSDYIDYKHIKPKKRKK